MFAVATYRQPEAVRWCVVQGEWVRGRKVGWEALQQSSLGYQQ